MACGFPFTLLKKENENGLNLELFLVIRRVMCYNKERRKAERPRWETDEESPGTTEQGNG